MARRRRRYGGTVGVNLGNLPLMGESVNTTDVVLGAAAGVVAAAVVKGAVKKFAPAAYTQAASTLGALMPVASGAAAAAALYFGSTKLLKTSDAKAKSYAFGAAMVSGALALWDFARANLGSVSPMLDFSGTVGVSLGGYNPGYGMLINDQSPTGYNGLIVADHSDQLSELAAVSMGPDDDGIDALVRM